MPMHIAVIGSGTTSPDLALPLTQLGGSDVQPRIVNPRLSAFARSPYEELLVDVGYADAAQGAAASGAGEQPFAACQLCIAVTPSARARW